MTPMKAIRAKCLDCCCGSLNEVRLCTAAGCPRYESRLGKNPNIEPRQLTEEQRATMAENMRKNLGRI